MIGKIFMSTSFKGCIRYVMEDKKLPDSQEVAFQNRAEYLFGNYCSGTTAELIEQFEDVRRLNPRLEKPVMHISLSLALGEQLERGQLIGLVQDLAREMNIDDRQYIAVSHIDTGHQHVHLVVNRVGLHGKTLKDSHNYQRMAATCRKLEVKHHLQQVLSPRRFLSPEQRVLPRWDERKEALRTRIQKALSKCRTLESLKKIMQQQGYQVRIGRGISFIDDKGVKIKGSEVGFSLRRIEQMIARQQNEVQKWNLAQMKEPQGHRSLENVIGAGARQETAVAKPAIDEKTEFLRVKEKIPQSPLEALLKQQRMPEKEMEPPLLPKLRKRQKKHRYPHL